MQPDETLRRQTRLEDEVTIIRDVAVPVFVVQEAATSIAIVRDVDSDGGETTLVEG